MNVLMVMPVSRIAMVCIVAHLCIVSVGTQAAFGTERDGVMAAQRSQAQTIATAIKAGYSVALVEKEDISTLAWPSVVRLRSERPPDWMVMRQSTPMRVVRTYHGTHADNIMMISIDALDNEDRGRDRDRIRSLAPGSRLIVCYMPMTASDIENDSMNNLMHLMHGPIRRAVARHESYGAAEQGMLYGIMFASGGGVVACADAIVRRTDDADASVSLPAQEALREVYRAKGQEEYSFYKNMSYEEFVTAYRHMYVTPDFDMYVEDLNIVFQGDQNETTEVSAATLRTAFGRALHALLFPDSQKAKETTRSRHEAVDRMAIRPEGSCLGAVIRRGHHVLVGSIAAPTVKVPSGEKVEMVPIDTIVEGRSGRTRAAAIDLRDAFVPITVSESSIPDIAVGTTVWVRGVIPTGRSSRGVVTIFEVLQGTEVIIPVSAYEHEEDDHLNNEPWLLNNGISVEAPRLFNLSSASYRQFVLPRMRIENARGDLDIYMESIRLKLAEEQRVGITAEQYLKRMGGMESLARTDWEAIVSEIVAVAQWWPTRAEPGAVVPRVKTEVGMQMFRMLVAN